MESKIEKETTQSGSVKPERVETLCTLYDQMVDGFDIWAMHEQQRRQKNRYLRRMATLSVALCMVTVWITSNAMPIKKYDTIVCRNCDKEVIYESIVNLHASR